MICPFPYLIESHFYRLWKAFAPDPSKKKELAKAKQGAVSSLRMGIR